MEYAIIQTGGKQYKAQVGARLKVEKLENEADSTVTFDKVLLLSQEGKDLQVGTPYVDGAKVEGKVVQHGRGDKVIVIHFKRRKHQLKRQGHRQAFSEVEITAIH